MCVCVCVSVYVWCVSVCVFVRSNDEDHQSSFSVSAQIAGEANLRSECSWVSEDLEYTQLMAIYSCSSLTACDPLLLLFC